MALKCASYLFLIPKEFESGLSSGSYGMADADNAYSGMDGNGEGQSNCSVQHLEKKGDDIQVSRGHLCGPKAKSYP